MEIYDISDPSKIKKHEIIDNSKSAAYSLLLPKKELAIAYSVLQIDVHSSEYPYEYKYTLLKEKNNEVNCWEVLGIYSNVGDMYYERKETYFFA